MFKGAEVKLSPHFNREEIVLLRDECESFYNSLFDELPYLGGSGSSSTINLIMGAIVLSVIVPLEKRNLEKQKIGEIIFFSFEGYFKSKPAFLRFLIGKFATTSFFISEMKKDIDKSKMKKYEGDFLLKHIETEGEDFHFAYDYEECAIHKLFMKYGKEEYLPYVCLGDYAMFKSYGIGFDRTQTIGNGASVCDFRFSKNGETRSGWPPETHPEWKI